MLTLLKRTCVKSSHPYLPHTGGGGGGGGIDRGIDIDRCINSTHFVSLNLQIYLEQPSLKTVIMSKVKNSVKLASCLRVVQSARYSHRLTSKLHSPENSPMISVAMVNFRCTCTPKVKGQIDVKQT